MKKKSAAIGLIIVAVIAGTFIFFGPGSGQKIKNGVKIGQISYSGYSMKEAEQMLSSKLGRKYNNYKITLCYGNRKWQISSDELNANYDIKGAVQEAYKIGRGNGFLRDIRDSITLLFLGRNVQMPISFDKSILHNNLVKISREINVPSKNASIKVQNDGSLIKVPETLGLKLDVEKADKLVADGILKMTNQVIYLPVITEKPKYTTADISSIDGEAGKCETYFNTSQANRISNMKKAAETIDGTVIMPGETISLNKILGPRNEKNGYKDAPVIIKNELVPGMGGGICQVATTVYKACLEACLQIVERKHHTFPPAYVPVGQDATIAGSYIDLKVKNTLKHNALIKCELIGSKIAVRVFSSKSSPARKVKIESQILETIDPGPEVVVIDKNLSSGHSRIEKKEKKGYKVAVFRNIYEGYKLISREQVSFDVYRPIRGVVRIGAARSQTKENEVLNRTIPDSAENIEEPDNPPDNE